jgi:hypothetical protein
LKGNSKNKDMSIVRSKKDQDLLKFIKETRMKSVAEWRKEIKEIQKYLQKETSKSVIAYQKDEMRRLKELIKIYK